ncbi:hypothetical protein FJZ26_00540 [Candidatus Parvarchaeota archaeon]|nr:hypothetical protein [Candidatus Parvarchaeota archaeon]
MKKLIDFISDKRISVLLIIMLFALGLAYFNGIKFGIDFSGGTRIPIVLEKPVDTVTMDEMVQTIKTRAAVFGLTEVKVRAVGTSEIYVEVPGNNPRLVSDIETLLSKQGVYQGVVDGKEALRGDDIYTGTIGQVSPSQIGSQADWAVSFSVTQKGANKFASVVKGKQDYPLYMFLDRPDAIVIISKKDLFASTSAFVKPVTDEELIKATNDALRLNGADIKLYLLEDFEKYKSSIKPETNRTKAIIAQNSTREVVDYLKAAGFAIEQRPPGELQPVFDSSGSRGQFAVVVREWKAVGLLSSPRLSPEVTSGIPNYGYIISGGAQGSGKQRALDAQANAKNVESILKGGALPVQISLGSTTSIPAPLGAEFLKISAIGAIAALVVISLFVAIRYRTPKIIIPIVFILLSEVTILVAIIGSFTIDLGAMAGIIAAIGVSVDAQILITDELLKKDTAEHTKKLNRAFSIITTNAFVAVVAMLPLLLFSGLVEIIGFATSTILGALLGVLISRPAYGAIVDKLFD